MQKYIVITCSIFFILISFFSFAQTPFGEGEEYVSPEKFKMKIRTQNKAEELKKNYFDSFYSCQAVRHNDLSFCGKASDIQNCKSEAEGIMEIRYLAEGRCGRVGEDYSSSICQAINNKQCNTVDEEERNVCRAFLNRDVRLLAEAGRKVLGYDREDAAEEALWHLNLYNGFKYYSVAACDRFQDDYADSFNCKILFGNKDPQEIIDQLALDLAYLQYAQAINNPEVCSNIEDNILQKKCKTLDYPVKDFFR